MENKYYTPTIEEFHVGFECEHKTQELIAKAIGKIIDIKFLFGEDIKIPENDLFEHHIFDGRNLQIYSLNPHLLKDFRVKYLDREDIESLGWELRTDENRDLHIPEYTIERFYLKDLADVFFTIYDDSAVDEYVFRGKIKNKSELKKLMMQLEIN
ncbi:MAG: hypothetical protein H7Y10_03640 [Flavobacterium sp.]|nr:hypothetical protein [Flavobacterium sp.]